MRRDVGSNAFYHSLEYIITPGRSTLPKRGYI